MVTLKEPAPTSVALVVTVNGDTAVATADCTSASTVASLAVGAVAKVAVKVTVLCKVLPVCNKWRLLELGATAVL